MNTTALKPLPLLHRGGVSPVAAVVLLFSLALLPLAGCRSLGLDSGTPALSHAGGTADALNFQVTADSKGLAALGKALAETASAGITASEEQGPVLWGRVSVYAQQCIDVAGRMESYGTAIASLKADMQIAADKYAADKAADEGKIATLAQKVTDAETRADSGVMKMLGWMLGGFIVLGVAAAVLFIYSPTTANLNLSCAVGGSIGVAACLGARAAVPAAAAAAPIVKWVFVGAAILAAAALVWIAAHWLLNVKAGTATPLRRALTTPWATPEAKGAKR